MRILTKNNKVIVTSDNKALLSWGADCKSGGITALRQVTGGTVEVPYPIVNLSPYGFNGTTVPTMMLINTATNFVFANSNDVAPTSVTVTFLDGKSSIASMSNLNISTASFSFDITATSADTINFQVSAIYGSTIVMHGYTFKSFASLPVYEVSDISGATYNFALNSDGYYESQNKNIDNSYAICKVTFYTQGEHVYLDCINYAESNYDFGILSNLNTTLTLSSDTDTTNVFKSFKGSSSTSVQTVDYGAIEAGENFINVKFRKDGSGKTGNDSLQFKVKFE